MKTAQIKITVFLLLLLSGVLSSSGFSQSRQFEDIVVSFEIPKLLQEDIMAQYDGNSLFLPVVQILSLLDIQVESDFEIGRFSGKYLDNKKFEINIDKFEADCLGKNFNLQKSDFNLTGSELFLKLNLFADIFKLKLYFDFSQLKVHLPLDSDFPAYQKLRRKNEYERLLREKTAVKDITELEFKRGHLRGGVADWVLTLNPLESKGQYLGLSLGGVLLGGDMTFSGTANTYNGLQSDQMRYHWRYVFMDNKYLSQIETGDIATYGGLSRNLKGVLLTNRPYSRREIFRTINVNGNIAANWEVELYVNNKLVDFVRTDPNGDYNFLTDIKYGTSTILLKLYGPNGEYETREEFYRVPFNLIPRKQIEYTLAGGVKSSQTEKLKYAQAIAYYGLTNNLTCGFGSDLPIASPIGEPAAFTGEITYNPFGNLLLNTTISPDNEITYNTNYSIPSVLSMSAGYVQYFANPFRNKLNKIDNLTVSLSSPLKLWNKYFSARYRIAIDRFNDYKSINMFYGIKIPIPSVNINYLGNYKVSRYVNRDDKSISSQFFISNTILSWFRPQFKISYDHTLEKISSYGVYLQKRLFRTGQMSFTFERNEITGSNQFMLSFNIFTDFADFTSRFFSGDDNLSVTQMQRGSIRFDQDNSSFRFVRRNGIGLGAAVVMPFLDENYNGIQDLGEQILPELKANIGGASGMRNNPGELYYYDGLRPYDDYIVKIDPYSLDNPMLQPAHENFRVAISPNNVTGIKVPIVTGAEITGAVRREVQGEQAGVGGIKVIVVNEVTGKETIITTFNDGEFFQLGIIPGMYRAGLDKEQLAKFGYISEPAQINFQIKTVTGGDTIENLNFVIKSK